MNVTVSDDLKLSAGPHRLKLTYLEGGKIDIDYIRLDRVVR